MKAYQEDLARIHDEGFGGFSERAAPWLLKTFRHAGIRDGRVVDLGCGSGVWAQALDRAKYRVWGIELSPAMIRLARCRVPRGIFRTGSFLDGSLPRCRAVTALGEVLNYRFDPRVGPRSLPRVLRRIRRALEPGGILVFDVARPGRGAGPKVMHCEGKGWFMVREHSEDSERGELTRTITTFRKVGKLYRRGQEVHRLQLYHEENVMGMLRGAGFRAVPLRGYGRMRFPKGCIGFLASV